MGKRRLLVLIMILLSMPIILCTSSCSKDDTSDSTSATHSEDISGSYINLFPEKELVPGDIDLGRFLNQAVIWEHTIYGFKTGKHNTALYNFDPNKLKITHSKVLSSDEQEDYAGIRLLEDKIMVKSRNGYYFLNGNLDLLGEKIAFPEQLQNELRRLDDPNGLYFNHFDISKEGRYVYYTDENERSLFRYDLINNVKIKLLPEIEIWYTPEPNPRSEKPRKLPYRLYDLLLTPNEQFLIAKVAGYREAYYIFNLNQIDQSFLIEFLPVNINWSTIQNFIPIYSGCLDNPESMVNLDLTIIDLTDNTKETVSIPLAKDFRFNRLECYATFNKEFFAFGLSNTKESENHKRIVEIFDLNSQKTKRLFTTNLQLGFVALSNNGIAILKYTNLYGDKQGFIMTK